MDLRWGLREESQDNHTVIEFCMQEIENCARMSLGPCFVVRFSLNLLVVCSVISILKRISISIIIAFFPQ